MNTKKKLVISLASLAIVFVVAIAAVGVTLAALNGTVNSTFNITYTAHNVKATVSATYKLGEEGEEINFTHDEDSEDPIQFLPDQTTATGTLTVKDPIALDWTTNNYVVVTYTFKNDWTSGDDGRTNLLITADKDTIGGGVEGLEITYELDGTDDFNDASLASIPVIAPGEEKVIKIKFALTDGGTKSVNLQVSLAWTLEAQAIAG